MNITSNFKNKSEIPLQYTALGENVNPPLYIKRIPDEAKFLVLWLIDSDAKPKPWTHWLLFDIPSVIDKIAEDDVKIKNYQGLANGGSFGYEGPNQNYFWGVHNYVFEVFALNNPLEIPRKSNKKDVEKKMSGRVIAKAQLKFKCTSPLEKREVEKNLSGI